MENERWVSIEGTNGNYEVSNLGNVKSLIDTNNIRILKQGTDRYGYKTVVLRINGGSKTFRVHRLVANAFIKHIDGKNYVDHIDTNKSNNYYKNLRWVTKAENAMNPISYERSILHSNGKTVFQYSKDGKFIRSYTSIKGAARAIGVDKVCISKVIRGKRKSCKGFLWSTRPIEK